MLSNHANQERHDHGILGNTAFQLASIGTAAALLFSGCTKFNDTPGPGKENFGRTVNGLSTMLAGIMAQQLETNANINVAINKPGWSDAKVTGTSTASSIHTEADLSLASCSFNASGAMGSMKGHIEKSEFDWNAVQTGPNTWKIERFGLKLNYTLTLNADHGKIQGTLVRPMGWDWSISGTFANGNVDVKVSTGPTDPNFGITGTITGR